MAYKEKNFQTEFKTQNKIFGIFELKLCKGTSLPFSAVADHQIKALLDVSSGEGLYHKISDSPIFAGHKTRFTKPKPFDCFNLVGMDAYIVIMFYTLRKKKNVYYIFIDKFIDMENQAKRKSITEEMAATAAIDRKSYLKRGN